MVFVLNAFELYRPSDIDDLLLFLDKHGSEARVLAGGTELLVLIRDRRIAMPKYLVDLSPLRKTLSYVVFDNDYVRIGALTTVRELFESGLGSDKRYAGFNDVYRGFGSLSLRFMATIGGNIVSATQYNDYITLLHVYDAYLKLSSLNGERVVSLKDFVKDKRVVDLKPNEVLVEIFFKAPGMNCSSSFMKFDRRKQLIAGIVTGATYMCLENDVITDIRVSFDMVSDKKIPSRAYMVEDYLRNQLFSQELVDKVVEEILPREMKRVSDWWTTGEYRLEMSKVVLRRNLYKTRERVYGGVV